MSNENKLEIEDQKNYPDYADYIMLKFFNSEWSIEKGGWVVIGDQPFTPREAAARTRKRHNKGVNWIPSYIESTKTYKMMSQKFQGSLAVAFDEGLMQVAAEGINDMNWAQQQIKNIASDKSNFFKDKYHQGGVVGSEYMVGEHVSSLEKVGKFGQAKVKILLESKRSKEDAPISEIKMVFNDGSALVKKTEDKKALPVRTLRLDQVEKG